MPASVFDRHVLIAVEERCGSNGECQLWFQFICVQVVTSTLLFSKGFVNILGPSYCDSQVIYTIYTEVSASPCVPELSSLRNLQGSSG